MRPCRIQQEPWQEHRVLLRFFCIRRYGVRYVYVYILRIHTYSHNIHSLDDVCFICITLNSPWRRSMDLTVARKKWCFGLSCVVKPTDDVNNRYFHIMFIDDIRRWRCIHISSRLGVQFYHKRMLGAAREQRVPAEFNKNHDRNHAPCSGSSASEDMV